jgi:hypothetical protein
MFVGSSSEAGKLVGGLSVNLEGANVEVLDWATSAWSLSRSTLDGLEAKLEGADFAAFILSADDVAIIRGEKTKVARDNVLFELGLSFGMIGRDRTFIIAPKESMHKASDLAGITAVIYEPDADARKAMKNPAFRISEEIDKQGKRDRGDRDGGARRGSTAHIEMVADGALEVFESRDAHFDELRKAVMNGAKVPAKFQFAAADGGRRWLELCRSGNYHYFERAKQHLEANGTLLAEKVCEVAETAAIDLVSLGSGDGSKDDIILRELAEKLAGEEFLYYYPIDISDILLAEAVRHVSRHGLSKAHFRCKAVLGDFTSLSSINEIIHYRSSPKLFSALGNVIGSFDESEIFAGIAGIMHAGDMVLIEANIGEPGDSLAVLKDAAANQWDLSTLAALGIPPSSYVPKQELKDGQSVVPETRTLVSYAVPRRKATAVKYTLSAMHHYNLEKLKKYVEKKLRVKIVEAIAGDGVCLLLGQRQS